MEKPSAKLLKKISRRGSCSGSGGGPASIKISDLRLVLVNFVVAGLEIASSVAFTFIPPLLLKSGYSETQMSIIFGVAPFIALFTVPVIGHWSDSCTSLWGRRRPFIFVLSIFLVISLVLLCFGQMLVSDPITRYIGMCVVAFAVILLDYASQAAINPCESLMADMLQSASNSNAGFMIYSAMLSLGSCVGYLLSALDWQSFGHNIFGTSEQTAMIIVLILFSITLLVTMVTARERPWRPRSGSHLVTNTEPPIVSQSSEDMGYASDAEEGSSIKLLTQNACKGQKLSFCLVLRTIIYNSFRLSFIIACLVKGVLILVKPIKNVYDAPMVLRRLFWADLLCWMALMAHSMFCTAYVATVVYGGSADAERGSIEDVRFDEGVRMGSLGLLLHSTTACIFSSFVQDSLTNLIGTKTTYIFGLVIFGISMLFTVTFPSVVVLNVCAAFSGLGFAVATTIPGTLITRYHDHPEIFFRDTRCNFDSEKDGIGGDMAILDSTYYLSQIILSIFMGKIVDATGLPHFYIVAASICGFLSAILATRVIFSAADYNKILHPSS